jgi:uncharacterized protein YfkK (UPF0435 family)
MYQNLSTVNEQNISDIQTMLKEKCLSNLQIKIQQLQCQDKEAIKKYQTLLENNINEIYDIVKKKTLNDSELQCQDLLDEMYREQILPN